ncbi:MAG TPA: ribosome recycling factor [Parachlamydiaceae bacterium]|nr:ribosome recycling factor [Parachlamydiaceae bacterium]
MNLKEQIRSKMALAIEHLNNELKGIRTGRASTAMLDNVFVEIYGSKVRVKDVSSITTPEARQILINPFDKQNTSTIGKAIEKANLGFMPIVEGNCIRIKIPPMDDSQRKEMVKRCKKEGEDAKISVRNIRREGNEAAKKQKASGDIPEDLLKKIEKEIQDMTDKFCKEIDDMTSKKEKEVMTI